ncbi:MAG: hypothetical protein ACKVVP_21605 [Chloroflexota bacterium]
MNLNEALLACFGGVVGAYVQAMAGYWLEGFRGLPRFDIAESGKRYLGGEKPGWWVVGIVFHLANGALLGMLYAATIKPLAMTWLGVGVLDGVAGGLIYGSLVWLVLMNFFVFPLSGAGLFGVNTGSFRLSTVTLLLHLAYGAVLGAIVRP